MPDGPRPLPDRARVLQLVTSFDIGGTERQFVALAHGLDVALFDLRLGCLRREGAFLAATGPWADRLREYRVPNLFGWTSLARRAELVRDLRRHDVQVLHCFNFYPNVFAIPAARLAGVPVIVASIRDMGDPLWSPAQRRAQALACRMADVVLVNAHAVADRLGRDGYDPRRIRVIPNGIDLDRFSRGAARAEGLRGSFGLAPDTPLVAVVCRLNQARGVELKGLRYYFGAAARLAERFPRARFLVVGDGPLRGELEEHARDLGLGERVLFTGFRTDVPELLSQVDLFVLPSLSEALSNSLLEAMALGLPAVATEVGGNAEAVEPGVTGLLVPPADSEALAGAIARLLGDPPTARAMGAAARRRVERCFSLRAMVEATENLYLDRLRAWRRRRFPEPSPLGHTRPAGPLSGRTRVGGNPRS